MRTSRLGRRGRLMIWASFSVAALVGGPMEAQAQTPTYYYYPTSPTTYSYVPSNATGGYYWTTAAPSQAATPVYTTANPPMTYTVPTYQATGTPGYTYQYYQPAPTETAPQAVQTVQAAPAAQPAPTTETVPVAPVAASNTAAPAATETQAAPASSGDPYGFLNWLNATRASYGLSAVGYDPNLSSWAALNNNQQAVSGLGHYVMGPARRQNAAVGGYPGIESMWMNSPAHRAALLDPTIRWIGIAGMGAYWTFNAN